MLIGYLEIRLKIWEETIEDGRVVPIIWDGCSYISPARIPSLLQVNKESRTVGLRCYQLRFGQELRHGGTRDSESSMERFGAQAKIFFNFDHDIAYFGLSCSASSMKVFTGHRARDRQLHTLPAVMPANREDIRRIQRLGINIAIMRDLGIRGDLQNRNALKTLLRVMLKIKEVVLVDECYTMRKAADEFGFVDLKFLVDRGFKNVETTRALDLEAGVHAVVFECAAVSIRKKNGPVGHPMLIPRQERDAAEKEARPLVCLKYLLTSYGRVSPPWHEISFPMALAWAKNRFQIGTRQVDLL